MHLTRLLIKLRLLRKEVSLNRSFAKTSWWVDCEMELVILQMLTWMQCHDYLDIPLGPCMNFIIGHNGSGKSAVLTALTLCLGGKVLATNRGTSLRSFIKEGRE